VNRTNTANSDDHWTSEAKKGGFEISLATDLYLSFSPLKLANNMFIFFPAVNWLYRLQMGLFTQLLSFNGLARCLPTICKKSWQQTSISDSRQKNDVLKNRLFSNYFCIYFTN